MPKPVPDSEECIKECHQFCGPCPNFKPNHLNEFEPKILFCSRGESIKPLSEIRDNGCFCFGCKVFKNYDLEGGWFCIYGQIGKR